MVRYRCQRVKKSFGEDAMMKIEIRTAREVVSV
nr:MAG TPA: hypothetical protein [Caudoviricetes sp.]